MCSSSSEPSRPRHRGDWWAGRLVSAVLGGCDGPFHPSCQDVFRWGRVGFAGCRFGSAPTVEVVEVASTERVAVRFQPVAELGGAERFGTRVHRFVTQTRDFVPGDDDVSEE